MNRARAIKVIEHYERTQQAEAMDRLHRRKGWTAFTDEALRDLALILIWERRLHNRFAAESRSHHKAKGAAA